MLRNMHSVALWAYPNQVLPRTATADVGSALAVLAGKVQPFAHSAIGVRHDPQPSFQNGSHNCNVGAMPQQFAVVQLAVLGKACSL